MRPTEKDLFAEEQSMPSMSFGEHIEELRLRLILAILGLAVGVGFTFIPPINLGQYVLKRMQEPATQALTRYRAAEAAKSAAAARAKSLQTDPFAVELEAAELARALRTIVPGLAAVSEEELTGRKLTLQMRFPVSDFITTVNETVEKQSALIALAPLEAFMVFFMVSLVVGLVVSSPWVFYQLWAFIAAGLYRHERQYVLKFLPFSIGLFLGGVLLCFFLVLPITLQFLLEFNVWLGIEPSLRITDWISFATFLPLVFGLAFQTPLAMMLLERIGILTAADFKKNRKFAIFGIVVASAVITPTGDPFTMMVLAAPVIALYELGIILIGRRVRPESRVDAA
jgi:sec-independent protein translocase protein TatC